MAKPVFERLLFAGFVDIRERLRDIAEIRDGEAVFRVPAVDLTLTTVEIPLQIVAQAAFQQRKHGLKPLAVVGDGDSAALLPERSVQPRYQAPSGYTTATGPRRAASNSLP